MGLERKIVFCNASFSFSPIANSSSLKHLLQNPPHLSTFNFSKTYPNAKTFLFGMLPYFIFVLFPTTCNICYFGAKRTAAKECACAQFPHKKPNFQKYWPYNYERPRGRFCRKPKQSHRILRGLCQRRTLAHQQ